MGFFDSFRPEKWTELAAALQLVPHDPFETFGLGMCFRKLERSRGLPASGPPSFQYWLCGKRRGVDVVVLQYTTGSGSSTTTWTGVIARINPPLWLGLEVTGENFFNRLFGGADINLGFPEADDKLRIHSFDPARTTMLLSPSDPSGRNVLQHLAGLAGAYTLAVGDSFVRVSRQGIHPDPADVLAMLDPALEIAAWLGARRMTALPPTAGEQAQHREWQRFADANGLGFDPHHMIIGGTRHGTLIEVGLEIEGQTAYTSLNARFPSSVPVVFRIARTFTPGFLQGVFSQDIEVGDPVVDAAFKIVGQPEDAVRQVLCRPALVGAFRAAASMSRDVQIGQQGLFMRVEGPSAYVSNLEALVGWACAVSQGLVGGPGAPVPYR